MFEKAKSLIHETDILPHYHPYKPLQLVSNASLYSLGAVLSHNISGGKAKPVSSVSNTLSTAERNYSQIEKEALTTI